MPVATARVYVRSRTCGRATNPGGAPLWRSTSLRRPTKVAAHDTRCAVHVHAEPNARWPRVCTSCSTASPVTGIVNRIVPPALVKLAHGSMPRTLRRQMSVVRLLACLPTGVTRCPPRRPLLPVRSHLGLQSRYARGQFLQCSLLRTPGRGGRGGSRERHEVGRDLFPLPCNRRRRRGARSG